MLKKGLGIVAGDIWKQYVEKWLPEMTKSTRVISFV
jgi:hypothetical protein